MTERELIQHLSKRLPTNANTIAGAGDDCAVIRSYGNEYEQLLKVDAIVEGVHFTASDAPERVGRKALARCLSDMAAMGGQPDSALVSIGLPADFDAERIMKLYDGIGVLAKEYDVAVVGGETTCQPGGLSVTVMLTGKVLAGAAVTRNGAAVGDAIFISGELGGSAAGHHLEFVPRIAEASWLVKQFEVSAMIDVSDGLVTDLGHLLRGGDLGAILDESYIPIRRAAKMRARESDATKTPLLAALTDGEDFELLFTVAANDAVRVKDGWREVFPEVPLSVIGRIESEPGVRLRGKDGIRSLGGIDGFDHFQ